MSAPRSRLLATDLVRLAFHGVRTHPLRAALSGLGIAIGIASMVAVIGISTSSQAVVKDQLAQLGTNLLTVSAGEDLLGGETELAPEAVRRVRALGGVQNASWTARLDADVLRSRYVDPGATGGLEVRVADGDLAETVGARLRSGTWFSPATAGGDVVVLGHTAAERLGITGPGALVRLGERDHLVIGVLEPVPLAPELDTAALVAPARAAAVLGFGGVPTVIYERSADEDVLRLRTLLPATVNPELPHTVKVSRPSDALAAKYTVDRAFAGLLLGVGSIALLVGGIGVANTMVITVLERRREIGLRRSLGATRSHILRQFLAEAVLLAALGGLVGALGGIGVTAVVAAVNGWAVAIPPLLPGAGVLATMLVGTVSGALPAVRAARTSPATALSA